MWSQNVPVDKESGISSKPGEKSFNDIFELVTNHYNPKPSSIVQRYKFNTRVRTKDESIATYMAILRQLSEFCEFGDTLEVMLRDRLVCGVNNDRIQRRLLAEPDLTFGRALQLAQAIETADQDTKDLATSRDCQTVHFNTGKPPKRTQPETKKYSCIRCGGHHLATFCRFKDVECQACKKKGHLARMCLSKQGRGRPHPKSSKPSSNQANYVEGVVKGDPEEEDCYIMFALSSNSSEPYKVTMNVEGSELNMEVDTGASKSIVSEETYKSLCGKSKHPVLEYTSVRLRTYTGESLNVLGQMNVKVKNNQQEVVLPLLVIKGNGPSLLWRDWLHKLRLNWQEINTVRGWDLSQELLKKHPSVFSGGLGTLRGMKAKIQVQEGITQKFFRPRIPYVLKAKVETELDRLVNQGIITPIQFSDWAAPIVPVVKQDGTIRVCGDYKLTANKVSRLESYPLPRIDDLFSALSGGQAFSKLDLSQVYLQLELDNESKKYLTINTHKGLFQYNRLPFGVSSAPAIFQRVIDSLFQGFRGVLAYLDDILITGTSTVDHLENLDKVLSKLSEAGLKLNKSKCIFMAPKVEYLGYIIDKNGLHPSNKKVEAIKEAHTPTCVTELKAFLGMINYYGRFLPNLSTKLAPLYALLHKKSKWEWGSEQQTAFGLAKEMLQSDSLLVHYDGSKKLVLECDASPYGVGAVLSHVMEDGTERPVGYASRTLSPSEMNYSQGSLRHNFWG